jgi:hypothetical protein
MVIKRYKEISSALLGYGDDLRQFDFMAMILTSWHLNNLTVFMTQKRLENGLILILPQSNIIDDSKFRLKESDFSGAYFSDCTLAFIGSSHSGMSIKNLIKRLINRPKAKTNPFYLISPGGINFKVFSSITSKISRIVLVKIDEGTASYITPAQHKRLKNSIDSERKEQRLNYQYFIDVIIDKIRSGYLLLSQLEIIDNLLFRKSNKTISTNTKLAKGLKSYYCKNSSDSPYSNCILFFKDFAILEDERLEDFYIDLFERLSEEGNKVIIKKHPNDTSIFFDEIVEPISSVEIMDYSGSGEQLIADLKPKIVIGGFSTVLFTCPAIFNIKTISYMTYYLNDPMLPKHHRIIMSYFYELFKSLNDNLIFVDGSDGIFNISMLIQV